MHRFVDAMGAAYAIVVTLTAWSLALPRFTLCTFGREAESVKRRAARRLHLASGIDLDNIADLAAAGMHKPSA